jgi:N-acyl-L-homoserine lactone synthetase
VKISIPERTSKAKMLVINNIVNYGKQNNVKVVVTVTKSGK